MITQTLEKLVHGQNLTQDESYQTMMDILADTNIAQTSAFLALLRAKGETVVEVLGIILALQESMVKVPSAYPVLDIVGTGGDKTNTINISTAASILAAHCGIKIAKHGNRAVTSQCGSADVLEELGLNIYLAPEQIGECIDKINFGFCFAPECNPSLKKMREIRTDLGIATLFNLIGPLLNPARASYYMIGVYDERLVPLCAQVLSELNTVHSMVFHSQGIDELTTCCPANVVEVIGDELITFELDPADYGFAKAELSDLLGDSASDNAKKIMNAFHGHPSAIADTLMLNAGVALYLYGKTMNIADGIAIARAQLTSGSTALYLNELSTFTQAFAHTEHNET
jgi:anthranilate phosphoribosyltransferase